MHSDIQFRSSGDPLIDLIIILFIILYYICAYALPKLWALLCASITMLAHGLSVCFTALTIAYQHTLPIVFGFCGNCATTVAALCSSIITFTGMICHYMLSSCTALTSACATFINALCGVMASPYAIASLVITCAALMLLTKASCRFSPAPILNPIVQHTESMNREEQRDANIGASNYTQCRMNNRIHFVISQAFIPVASLLNSDTANPIITATPIDPPTNRYPQSAVPCSAEGWQRLPHAHSEIK